MTDADLDRIYANLLFEGVNRDAVRPHLEALHVRELVDNEVLFEAGDKSDGLYLLLQGAIRITVTSAGGHQLTLGMLEAGDFFGEMAVIEMASRSASASAALPARVVNIPEDVFSAILEVAPVQVARNLTRGATRKVRMLNKRHLEEVVRAERLKLIGQMASSIAHDLRNPIGRVKNIAVMMEDPAKPMTTATMADILRRAARGMGGMVQDLLDFSQGEWRPCIAPTSVSALIDGVQDELLDILAKHRIDLERRFTYDGGIFADHNMLVRGLINIAKNAAEAMSAGGTICIESETAGDNLIIRISDTGPGIPDSILPYIFEPYKTFGKAGGTGLGMAITRTAVEAHGGRVAVRSSLGHGTTFEVTIPLIHPTDEPVLLSAES